MLNPNTYRNVLPDTLQHDFWSASGITACDAHQNTRLSQGDVQQLVCCTAGPYMLWDKALKVRAVWDSRAHNQVWLPSSSGLLVIMRMYANVHHRQHGIALSVHFQLLTPALPLITWHRSYLGGLAAKRVTDLVNPVGDPTACLPGPAAG